MYMVMPFATGIGAWVVVLNAGAQVTLGVLCGLWIFESCHDSVVDSSVRSILPKHLASHHVHTFQRQARIKTSCLRQPRRHRAAASCMLLDVGVIGGLQFVFPAVPTFLKGSGAFASA